MPFRNRYTGLIEAYRDRLPVRDDTRIISLGEGNTPLIRLNNIPRELGVEVDIYVKYESHLPSSAPPATRRERPAAQQSRQSPR